ncbi:hypothetical protein DAI22_12g134701 [Oryza sativa Japonica Group]|nr:hypothetical protein DAI22_12g134701 [Oryza sativa Japonica Group]
MAVVNLPPRRPSRSSPAYKREPRLLLYLHIPSARLSLSSAAAPLSSCAAPSCNSGRPSPAVRTSSDSGDTTFGFVSSSSSPSTPPSSTRTTGTTTTTRSSPPFRPHRWHHLKRTVVVEPLSSSTTA